MLDKTGVFSNFLIWQTVISLHIQTTHHRRLIDLQLYDNLSYRYFLMLSQIHMQDGADYVNFDNLDKFGRAYATGRRKTSVARVWINEGSGQFIVNDNHFVEYFQPMQRDHILGAFLVSSTAGMFDIWCTVKGGGMSGLYLNNISQ